MSRTLSFISMLMSCTAAFIFATACSSDDGPDNKGDNVPTESRNEFVGVWNGSMGQFVFFNDGYSKLGTSNFGKWTYNKDTNILATTNSGWQFLVTLSAENEWAAIGISSKEKTYTFQRVSGVDEIYAIIEGAEYTDMDGKLTTMPTSTVNYQIGTNNTSRYVDAIGGLCGGYVEFKEDNDGNDHTYEYQAYTLETIPIGYWHSGQKYFAADADDHGTAVFTNLYSAEKCKLVMTSSHKKKEDRITRTFVFDNRGN